MSWPSHISTSPVTVRSRSKSRASIYVERQNSIPILKVGADAMNVGVVKIQVGADFTHTSSYEVFDLTKLSERDPVLEALYQDGQQLLAKVRSLVLFARAPGAVAFNSRNVRWEQVSMGTLICDAASQFFHADATLIPGGYIRGNKLYEGDLTPVDISTELPFPDGHIFVATMTGDELQAAVAFSMTRHKGKAGYLQMSSTLEWDSEQQVLRRVGQRPLALQESYRVCVLLSMLKGMDNNDVLIALGQRVQADTLNGPDSCVLIQDAVSRFGMQALAQRDDAAKEDLDC
jgi:hypothetical protein